jgi:uncharacterized protein (TIGR02453 family)
VAPGREGTGKIRTAIVAKPDTWKRAGHDKQFRSRFHLSGDRLKRAPSGFPADHPLMDDLKWKDHVGSAMLDERTMTSENFLPHYAELCRVAAPYVGFLCESLGLPF